MRTLFDIDLKNYKNTDKIFSRPSVRGIAIKDGKILVVYSKKYDYYKFPGGGPNEGESHIEALIREVREESGYSVIPSSIVEFGQVTRKQASEVEPDTVFHQENYYYLCEVEETPGETNLDDYEAEEGFTAMWVTPLEAIRCNRYTEPNVPGKSMVMIKREKRVFEMVRFHILDMIHHQKEHDLIASLGHDEYFEMVDFVRSKLNDKPTEDIGAKAEIFYSRFEHTKRVLAWAKRLYDHAEDKSILRYDELMIATIFHDVGRYIKCDQPHAVTGVPITREYLLSHGYPSDKVEYICSLVGHHSDKWRMHDSDLDPNLLLLMEADDLDDMGAQGIVMDCMITQTSKAGASFYDCFNHITSYTQRQQREGENHMVSPYAKMVWDEKTKLVTEFMDSLERDIAYDI